jgi:hypothetical protein
MDSDMAEAAFSVASSPSCSGRLPLSRSADSFDIAAWNWFITQAPTSPPANPEIAPFQSS